MARARTTRFVAVSLAILAALALPAGIALAATRNVAIAGFAYQPATITISAGDRVVWTNADAVGHTATADDGSFDTGNIATGASRGVTFGTPGTYPYYCVPHPSMRGTVVVRGTAGPGNGGTGPDTSTALVTTTADGGLATRLGVLSLAASLGALLAVRLGRRRVRAVALLLRVRHAPLTELARHAERSRLPRR